MRRFSIAVATAVAACGAPAVEPARPAVVVADVPASPTASASAAPDRAASASAASASAVSRPEPPTRVAQCNALIEKVNAAGEATKKAVGSGKGSEMDEMAAAIDSACADIASVALPDARLVGLQRDYMRMLADIASAARRLQIAITAGDGPAMQSCLKEIQAAAAEEATIVANINTYCTTGK